MTPTEKVILKKTLDTLKRGIQWNGMSTDWQGYAKQMKNSMTNSIQFIETLFEIPDEEKSSSSSSGSKDFLDKLDEILP